MMLSDILKDAIENKLLDVHTVLPARVIEYNSSTQTCSVQPEIKRKLKNEVVELPIINDVPVLFPRSTTIWVHFPLEKGDQVILLFCERSIDKWKLVGGSVDPQDARHHSLSDAFAIPAGYPLSKPMAGIDTQCFSINNVLSKFELTKTGKVWVGNKQENLLQIVKELGQKAKSIADECSVLTVNTVVGTSSVPNNAANFQTLSLEIAAILSRLEMIIK